MHPKLRILACWAAAGIVGALQPAAAALVTWSAAGGQLPDVAVPQWDLIDSASPENPALSSGVLTLGGSAVAEQMYYSMTGANTDYSSGPTYWLEARLRVNTQSLTAGWWRAPVTMGIGFAGGGLAVFELRRDYVFLRNGNNSVGAFSDLLDTDTDFHTWRMEVLGSTAGSIVNVYQDGNLVLSDNAVFNFGSGNRVFWGDSSVLAGGRSEWTDVSTNLARVNSPDPAVVSSPGTLALASLGLLGAAAVRRRAAQG
jgi:hypothetical protein